MCRGVISTHIQCFAPSVPFENTMKFHYLATHIHRVYARKLDLSKIKGTVVENNKNDASDGKFFSLKLSNLQDRAA